MRKKTKLNKREVYALVTVKNEYVEICNIEYPDGDVKTAWIDMMKLKTKKERETQVKLMKDSLDDIRSSNPEMVIELVKISAMEVL